MPEMSDLPELRHYRFLIALLCVDYYLESMIDEPALSLMLDQARAAVDEGKLLHAVQHYRRILSLLPSFEIAWIELSQLFAQLKNYEAAEGALLKALQHSNDATEIIMLLGDLNSKIGKYEQALSYYKRLLDQEKNLSHSLRIRLHFNAGLTYFYRNNFRLAEQHFRATRRLEPKFPKINESIAELLLRRGAVAEATDLLNQAIAVDPYSFIAHYLLGTAYARMYDWRKSYEEFVAAIDNDPSEPTAWQMCGEVLLKLQQLDEAEQYLRKALELNPHLTDAIVNFGYLFLKRGDHQRAREYFEQALKLEPDNPKALQAATELKLATRFPS